MKQLKIVKAGAIAFVVLGILHLLFQFGPKPIDTELHQLLTNMESYKIKMMGVHSLLQFHNGFSINMGFLLFAFGIQHLLLAKEILKNRNAFMSTILITAVIFLIALLYFHALAFGFVFFSLLCFIVAFIQSKPQVD